ncbi:MAG: SIS domain-containing protein, partial [Gaiellales bacterium]
EVLAAMADAYAAPDGPLSALTEAELRGRRVLFMGMGSSRFAALTAAALLRSRGIDAHAELASTGTPQPPSGGTLAVAISASGRSPETVEAMHRHLGTSRVLAVTNQPERELGRDADLVLPVLAGEEQGGIACKSYQCTLGVLLLLCGRILGEGGPTVEHLRAAAASQAELLGRRGEWLELLTVLAEGGAGVWVVGPDARFGSACQSALMLREAPRIVSAACETGDWLHVDVYLTKRPGYRALLLSGSRFDLDLMRWAGERDFPVVSVGRPVRGARLAIDYPGAGRHETAALVETAVAELLAAELWARHPI